LHARVIALPLAAHGVGGGGYSALEVARQEADAWSGGIVGPSVAERDRDIALTIGCQRRVEDRDGAVPLTDRIEATANSVMRSDLVPLTSDLPATAAVGIATQPAGVRGVGDVKRSGAWTVPAENSFRTWFGHIKLDLRQAQFSVTETHIHARALFGNLDLLVPEGVEVEVQARTQVGRTNLQASSRIPGPPRIVLTGGTFFGDIKVRHRRLWEKLGRRGRLTD
jgi:Cell wall-active antibiotics response 4TMS YvqF